VNACPLTFIPLFLPPCILRSYCFPWKFNFLKQINQSLPRTTLLFPVRRCERYTKKIILVYVQSLSLFSIANCKLERCLLLPKHYSTAVSRVDRVPVLMSHKNVDHLNDWKQHSWLIIAESNAILKNTVLNLSSPLVPTLSFDSWLESWYFLLICLLQFTHTHFFLQVL
jgi:hypothetical protein